MLCFEISASGNFKSLEIDFNYLLESENKLSRSFEIMHFNKKHLFLIPILFPFYTAPYDFEKDLLCLIVQVDTLVSKFLHLMLLVYMFFLAFFDHL